MTLSGTAKMSLWAIVTLSSHSYYMRDNLGIAETVTVNRWSLYCPPNPVSNCNGVAEWHAPHSPGWRPACWPPPCRRPCGWFGSSAKSQAPRALNRKYHFQFSPLTKFVNSNIGRESSFPVSVESRPAMQPSKQTAKAAADVAEHKQEMSSLNLNLSLHACL